MSRIQNFGTRKRAIARATLKPGNGIVRINSRLLQTLHPELYRLRIEEPLIIASDDAKKVDISVNVSGGGSAGQADAIRLAIAKVLVVHNKKLQKEFLDYDRTLLVADVRRKEKSKPNRHGQARSKRQKSYR